MEFTMAELMAISEALSEALSLRSSAGEIPCPLASKIQNYLGKKGIVFSPKNRSWDCFNLDRLGRNQFVVNFKSQDYKFSWDSLFNFLVIFEEEIPRHLSPAEDLVSARSLAFRYLDGGGSLNV